VRAAGRGLRRVAGADRRGAARAVGPRTAARGDAAVAGGPDPLVDALADLYAFLYRVERDEVVRAAALRVEAMDVSDRWVAAGCALESPLIDEERSLLVRSYATLLAAVHR